MPYCTVLDGNMTDLNADFLSFDDDPSPLPTDNDEDQSSPAPRGLLPPWMDQPNNFRQSPPLIALHNELVAFYNLMSLGPSEMREREELIARFTSLAKSTFGANKVRRQKKPFAVKNMSLNFLFIS